MLSKEVRIFLQAMVCKLEVALDLQFWSMTQMVRRRMDGGQGLGSR